MMKLLLVADRLVLVTWFLHSGGVNWRWYEQHHHHCVKSAVWWRDRCLEVKVADSSAS